MLQHLTLPGATPTTAAAAAPQGAAASMAFAMLLGQQAAPPEGVDAAGALSSVLAQGPAAETLLSGLLDGSAQAVLRPLDDMLAAVLGPEGFVEDPAPGSQDPTAAPALALPSTAATAAMVTPPASLPAAAPIAPTVDDASVDPAAPAPAATSEAAPNAAPVSPTAEQPGIVPALAVAAFGGAIAAPAPAVDRRLTGEPAASRIHAPGVELAAPPTSAVTPDATPATLATAGNATPALPGDSATLAPVVEPTPTTPAASVVDRAVAETTPPPTAPLAQPTTAVAQPGPTPAPSVPPPPAVPVEAPRAQVTSTVEDLSVHLTRVAAGRQPTITVQLQPAALGRLDITLAFEGEDAVRVVVRADRPEALEQLARHGHQLERALQQSGLDVGRDGIRFDLNPQGQEGAAQQRRSSPFERPDRGTADGGDADQATTAERLDRHRLLDLNA